MRQPQIHKLFLVRLGKLALSMQELRFDLNEKNEELSRYHSPGPGAASAPVPTRINCESMETSMIKNRLKVSKQS